MKDFTFEVLPSISVPKERKFFFSYNEGRKWSKYISCKLVFSFGDDDGFWFIHTDVQLLDNVWDLWLSKRLRRFTHKRLYWTRFDHNYVGYTTHIIRTTTPNY